MDFSAVVYPENACNTTVSWSNSDDSVIKLSNGSITAIGYGTATLTATTFNNIVSSFTVTVKEITATDISIQYDTDTMYIGETQQLSAVLTPEDIDNPAVTWETSDSSVAVVSASGVLTAKSAGSAEISVTTSNNITSSYIFTFLEKYVDTIHIIETPPSVFLGDSMTLQAEIEPFDATDSSVNWYSSNPSVAAIGDSGNLSAVACGSVSITAISSNGLTDEIDLQVIEVPAESISIQMATQLHVGEIGQCSVDILPENTTSKDIIWEVSDETIATIDKNGVVTTCGIGTVVISAIQKDLSASAVLQVLPIPVEEMHLLYRGEDKLFPGDTAMLLYSILPENATDPSVQWCFSAPEIVAIANNGKLTAVKSGTATIFAETANGICASYSITIHSKVAPILLLATGVFFLAAIGTVISKKRKKN